MNQGQRDKTTNPPKVRKTCNHHLLYKVLLHPKHPCDPLPHPKRFSKTSPKKTSKRPRKQHVFGCWPTNSPTAQPKRLHQNPCFLVFDTLTATSKKILKNATKNLTSNSQKPHKRKRIWHLPLPQKKTKTLHRRKKYLKKTKLTNNSQKSHKRKRTKKNKTH